MQASGFRARRAVRGRPGKGANMRPDGTRNRGYARYTLTVALLLVCAAVVRSQDSSTVDPVNHLELLLESAPQSLEARDSELQARVSALRTFDELRRALLLRAWRDVGADPSLAAINQKHHEVVAGRIVSSLRRALRQEDVAVRLEALRLISSLDGTACGPDGMPPARGLTTDVIVLLRDGPAAVHVAAARALGRIGPDAVSAAPALAGLLRDPDPGLRVAAAEGLVGMLEVATTRAAGNGGAASPGMRDDLVRTACAVLPAAATGFGDGQASVRRRCVEAVGRSATLLASLTPLSSPVEETDGWPAHQRRVDDERAALESLVVALKTQTIALARYAADVDPEIRLATRQALDETAQARLRIIRRLASALTAPENQAVAESQLRILAFLREDPLLQGLQETLPALAVGIDDPDVRVRRATLDVLEAMGHGAASAIPTLVRALSDRDRFVRWAAARALGKVRPRQPETVVPYLAALLGDADPDLRVTAAASLREYGKLARSALPALLAAAQGRDPELRAAAIRTLETVGGEDAAALAVLNAALTDGDLRVRQVAEQALGRVGSRDAIDAPLRPQATDRFRRRFWS